MQSKKVDEFGYYFKVEEGETFLVFNEKHYSKANCGDEVLLIDFYKDPKHRTTAFLRSQL